MPIYFDQVAPYCPISRDSPPSDTFRPRIRTSIPKPTDLPSAINTANIVRSIVTELVVNRTRTNVFRSETKSSPKPKKSRWREDKGKRVLRKYKYYVTDEYTNEINIDAWVQTERVERMVWVDTAYNVRLTWLYGEGEGYPDGVVPTKPPAREMGDAPDDDKIVSDDKVVGDDKPPPEGGGGDGGDEGGGG